MIRQLELWLVLYVTGIGGMLTGIGLAKLIRRHRRGER